MVQVGQEHAAAKALANTLRAEYCRDELMCILEDCIRLSLTVKDAPVEHGEHDIVDRKAWHERMVSMSAADNSKDYDKWLTRQAMQVLPALDVAWWSSWDTSEYDHWDGPDPYCLLMYRMQCAAVMVWAQNKVYAQQRAIQRKHATRMQPSTLATVFNRYTQLSFLYRFINPEDPTENMITNIRFIDLVPVIVNAGKGVQPWV